jgi:hypothetical protein
VSDAEYNPDGQEVATGGDNGEITLWTIGGNTVLSSSKDPDLFAKAPSLHYYQIPVNYESEVKTIEIKVGESTYLAKAERDQIFVSEASSGILFLQLKHQFDHLAEIALDPERNLIVARGQLEPDASSAAQYQTWPFVRPLSELIPAARRRVLRCLGPQDREKAGLNKMAPDWCIAMRKPPYDPANAVKQE